MVPGRVPPREVVRIFVSIVVRGLISTAIGLVVAKLVFLTGIEPDRDTAINVGYSVVAIAFFLSFFFKNLPGPELEYLDTPAKADESQPAESLIDFLYEKDDSSANPEAAGVGAESTAAAASEK
jgi:hypothetical protein